MKKVMIMIALAGFAFSAAQAQNNAKAPAAQTAPVKAAKPAEAAPAKSDAKKSDAKKSDGTEKKKESDKKQSAAPAKK